MAAANWFLAEQFLPAFNQRFTVQAEEPGTAFVPWIGAGLADLLCVQEERGVATDNTVHYQGQRLQIPQDPHRFHYVKVTVRVHEYPEGTLAVFHGPRCLARYTAGGERLAPASTPPPPRTTRRSAGCPTSVDPGATVHEHRHAR
jgi:hypothetical protein